MGDPYAIHHTQQQPSLPKIQRIEEEVEEREMQVGIFKLNVFYTNDI